MIHCFYHSADLDGMCSGAIVKYRYPDAVMHPINYGDPFPWDEIHPDDEVYMVDFCLQPVEDMHRLCLHETNVIWIDHHSSAIRAVEEIGLYPAGVQGTDRAACELTWEYLFPDRPVPLAVKLLSLYDSWTYHGHELEDMVLPFQMRMWMEELDPKNWGDYEEEGTPAYWWIQRLLRSDNPGTFWIRPLIEEGRLLLRYDEKMKADYVKAYAFRTRLLHSIGNNRGREILADMGFNCIAVNLGHTNSKVFDSVWRKECAVCRGIGSVNHCIDAYGTILEGICKGCNGTGYIEPYDIMISFCRRSDKLWNVSLYSTKPDIDCGAIAKSFGGGGHKGAAGFQCKELSFEY